MLYYRIKENKLYDYAEYEYDKTCLQTNIITMKELQAHPNKVIVGDIEKEIDVPDYDEDGNPIMIEYEDTETVIDYDDEGNPIGSHNITVIKHKQQTHKETITVKGLILNPNYEQEEAEKERQRLDNLTLTPSDVERALYYSDLHMDFDDLKALIAEQAPTIDLKGLAIEFRANNFYRGAVDKNGNRIVDMVGLLLGYTSQDMDYLFEHKQLPIKEVE